MEFCETGEYPVRPVNVVEYLRQAQPEPVQLANKELSARDHPALKQLREVSGLYWEKTKNGVEIDPSIRALVLQAEGSCFVLDQDPEYKNLTALLASIQEKLDPPKIGKGVTAGNDHGATSAPAMVQEPSSTRPSRRQESTTRLASKPNAAAKSANTKRNERDARTVTNKNRPSTNKKAAARKKGEKTQKR